MKLSTGLITTSRFQDHLTGPGHPESPQRLTAVLAGLENTGLLEQLQVVRPGTSDAAILALVHQSEYINRVKNACLIGAPWVDSFDNPICPDSYEIALLAAAASVTGVDLIFTGEINNAMTLLRPPGHHAEKDLAMGFCFFNNVAIVARYAQIHYHVEKIAIIDFDVHHGNGTQHIFEDDPSVFYFSIHRYPFYPGTGGELETGRGKGLGTTRNYPLSAGTGDNIYLDIVENSLSELIFKFKPDFIILSAGFDAHELDPIGGMAVTTEGYRQLTNRLKQLAVESCKGKLLSVLEGGYSLKGLSESVNAHLEVLAGL